MMQPVPILGQQGNSSVNASSYARNPNVYESNPNTYGRNPNVYESNPNTYDRNPNVYESNPNTYDRNPNVYERNPNTYERNPNVVPDLRFDDTIQFDPNSNFNIDPPVEPYFNVNTYPSQEKSGFFDPGGFGYEYLGPRLGENIGQFFGEQLYGTGIDADGQATGFPVDRPSLLGDAATLPGNTLRALDYVFGPVVDRIPGAVDYITGASGVSAQAEAEDEKNAEKFAKAAQELSRLMEGVEPNSPQANFLREKSKGDLTPDQIADANAYAKSIGTTFDSTLGYSRTPFQESGSDQPQITKQQLEQLVSPGLIAPMGEAETKARLAQKFGFDAPVTVNQAIANNPNVVMGTDAQGRMRSFASSAARQQNLANAQISYNQASLGRQIRDGGTGSFEGDSGARNARVGSRDKRPGETQTQRDTRIAKSRTQGSRGSGEMSFEEARKFIPKGQKETSSSYNERIKAYQAQQNGRISKVKQSYDKLRNEGQTLNNEKTQAYIDKVRQTKPDQYMEVLETAKGMLRDGTLEDQEQMAMYIVDEMGGRVSSMFDSDNKGVGFNPSQLNARDRQAYDYAIDNPDDPRSQQILDKLGVE